MAVDKSAGRVRRMFGGIAARYDFLNHVLSAGIDSYWRRKTVRTVAPRDDGPILDVCTGTGDLAFGYWKQSGRRVPVIGADFTHEMLKLANRKRSKNLAPVDPRGSKWEQRAGTITFLEADALELPLADDVFQIVSVAFGLRNMTDPERGLREMVRVCRPGGRVVILEFSLPGNQVLRTLYGWYFRHVLPRVGQLISRSRDAAYNYLPQSVAQFPQDEELAEMMSRCGLVGVHFKPLTFGIATLYWGEK